MEEYNIQDLKEFRGKKSKFKIRKENTINSLKEVECFLWNWKRACKGIALYKIMKK